MMDEGEDGEGKGEVGGEEGERQEGWRGRGRLRKKERKEQE